ncbi:ImmA/IrrE family metallo-endopeptidase [Clostridium tertium]
MGKIIYLHWKDGIDMEKRDIEKKTNEILSSYDILDIPVDPIDIAKKLNIKVFSRNFNNVSNDTVSGAIKKEKNDINIYVNEDDTIERKRFTIAHELGHYFLHLQCNQNTEFVDMHRRTGYKTELPKEKEANQFAAAILMPQEKVKELYNSIKNLGVSESFIIEWLSEKFFVSKPAMKFRLKNLGLI